MRATTQDKNPITWFSLGLAIAVLGLSACNISDNTSGGGSGTGLALSVTDTTQIELMFSDSSQIQVAAMADFNLADTRSKVADKGIDLSTVSITDMSVSCDSSTLDFLTANAGVPFWLKIFVQSDSADSAKLALETDTTTLLTLDPNQAIYALNHQLFGSEAGFSTLISAVQDTTKSSLQLTGEVNLASALKKTGNLTVNLVVTVTGKKQL